MEEKRTFTETISFSDTNNHVATFKGLTEHEAIIIARASMQNGYSVEIDPEF